MVPPPPEGSLVITPATVDVVVPETTANEPVGKVSGTPASLKVTVKVVRPFDGFTAADGMPTTVNKNKKHYKRKI